MKYNSNIGYKLAAYFAYIVIFNAALLILNVDSALAGSGKQPSLSAVPASEEKTKYNRVAQGP